MKKQEVKQKIEEIKGFKPRQLFGNRIFQLVLFIVIELILMSLFFSSLALRRTWNLFFQVLSYAIVVYIINQNKNPAYKLVWIMIILAIPMLGGIYYILFADKKVPKALRSNVDDFKLKHLVQDRTILDEIHEQTVTKAKQINYVWKKGNFPVYKNSNITYFPLGEDKYEAMLRELKKAEKFIFLEYFIVHDGVMWQGILDILKEKALAGVEIKMMYDDAGSISTLPNGYCEYLKGFGIDCVVFNPLRPRLVMQMNNRDHRKICVVDNRVAFVGGINLADEYINVKERFGHWKDTAVMIEGEAVWSVTSSFIQFYRFISKQPMNYDDYYLRYDTDFTQGYVQPYTDSPTDNEEISLNIHLNMINNAKEYVYMMTPYLIITHEMITALCLAAKSGVDVRIVNPGIPDKWYAHIVSQANYQKLIEAGVKVYEYNPGFVHAKVMLSDDAIALVGTANMDYRSYYLHYENGVLIYDHPALKDIHRDFEETIDQCVRITLQDCYKVNPIVRILRALLNIFAPMM